MTEIDIERLRKSAVERGCYDTHWDGCIYEHRGCAVLALIERLERADAGLKIARRYTPLLEAKLRRTEAQRDRLIDAANVMVNVFVPRSDSSPDAHVEQEAWKKLDHVIDAVFAENKMLKENR